MSDTRIAYYAGYVAALVKYISEHSPALSYSYVSSYCFNTIREIEEVSGMPLKRSGYELIDMTIEEKLGAWFGKSDIVRFLERVLGKCQKVYEITDDKFIASSDGSKGWSIFYSTEEMVLAKFKECYVLFILGNNE